MKFFSNGQGQPEQTHTHTAELEKKKFYNKLGTFTYTRVGRVFFLDRLHLLTFTFVKIRTRARHGDKIRRHRRTDERADGAHQSVGNHIRRGSSSELNLGGTRTHTIESQSCAVKV